MRKQKQLKTYDSKFVDFLCGNNVIILNSHLELVRLRNICVDIGLSMLGKEVWIDLLADIDKYDRQHNKKYATEPVIYVEYQNQKGFGIYKETKEKLIEWYGVEPITMKEICEELSIEI